jgi:hypothetical protein
VRGDGGLAVETAPWGPSATKPAGAGCGARSYGRPSPPRALAPSPAESHRQRANRAEVGGDVLAAEAVAARRALDE